MRKMRENEASADNQQATSTKNGESPQRLQAKYPKKTEISYSEATLLGILFTDGCLSRKGKNSWRFYLGNTSWEIIQNFRENMINLFNLDNKRIRISQKLSNGKPYYKAIVNDAECGNILFAKYGTFRTLAFNENGRVLYPYTNLPLPYLTSKNLISQFLKAAFSCDGGVKLYAGKDIKGYKYLIRNVFLSCYHPQLRLQYQQLLSDLDIRSVIIKNDNRILIRSQSELRKFQQKVGFLKGVKITQHSAYWQGVEKNNVLDLLISSYGNPGNILALPQFLG